MAVSARTTWRDRPALDRDPPTVTVGFSLPSFTSHSQRTAAQQMRLSPRAAQPKGRDHNSQPIFINGSALCDNRDDVSILSVSQQPTARPACRPRVKVRREARARRWLSRSPPRRPSSRPALSLEPYLLIPSPVTYVPVLRVLACSNRSPLRCSRVYAAQV